MVAPYDRMGLAPGAVGFYLKAAWADLVENGLVSPSVYNVRTKRRHVRGYQKGLRTAKNMRVRSQNDEHLDAQIVREARFLPRVSLPLVLKFEFNPHGFMYPELFGITHVENNSIRACWTCVTKIGVFVVLKHDEKKYEAFLVRSHYYGDNVLLSRTLGQCANNRAGAMAALCGQAWVMNMGKPYSLYDLYTPATRDGETRSVWFKFENERVPKQHIRAVIFDKNAVHAQWVWAAHSADPRWQPRPLHRSASRPELEIPRFPYDMFAGYFPQKDPAKYDSIHHYVSESREQITGYCDPYKVTELQHLSKQTWNWKKCRYE